MKEKSMQKNPKITVIMPTFNRREMLEVALDSILKQTYKDFELIIVDDCSSDGTQEFLEDMAQKDSRIIYVRNKKHQHYNYGLRLGCKMARGEYIARMDDDDISLPKRFEKQVRFLDDNPDIAVVGTFFELLGDNGVTQVWVDNSKPEFCALDAFYRCPLCHPTVMIRKSFLQEKHVGYDAKALYAEDTMLWIDIILAGGKIANIPEVLLKYRVGHARVSSVNDTKTVQNATVYRAREKMWKLCFSSSKAKKLSYLGSYPKLNRSNAPLCNALMKVAERNLDLFPQEVVYEYLVHMGVKSNHMHICFAGNNQIAEKMCVAITSIVRHMRSFDTIDFFILEDNISDKNKKKMKQLENNNVSIEFIRIDAKRFENRCPHGVGCAHVPVQTYFRYIIPELKPNYDKVLYLDCDMVVRRSLCELWETELGDNYAAAVQEFYYDAANKMKIKVPTVFNAGMLLLNNKKLVEDNIAQKLFENTDNFKDKIVYVDQDILNYTFRDKVVWVEPIYNAQIDLWRPGTCAKPIYSPKQMWWGKNDPVIVHYNGANKPWKDDGYKELKKYQPFVNEYYKNLIRSPYKYRYWKNKIKKYLYNRTETEDVIKTKIMFLKFRKNKKLKPSLFLQKINYANSHIWALENTARYLSDRVGYISQCVWNQEQAHFEKQLQRLENITNQTNERINYLSKKIDMCGNIPQVTYFNKQESFYIKNFVKQYQQMPQKEAFLELIKGLDDQSIDTISKTMKRIDLIDKENYQQLDLWTEKEKMLLNNIKKDFWQNVLELDENTYCYRHYILPKNDFEIDIFYENYGLAKLQNKPKLSDKDIIDAGAYIGDSALLLQEYTQRNVYAFEPERENYEMLLKTIELNHSERIIPENLALSNKSGKNKIAVDGLSSSMKPIVDGLSYQSVETTTIDQYVKTHHLNVGLVKLDVEGFEQNVLHGAIETIKSQKPILLISIYHNAHDFFEIKPWLDSLDLGYTFKIFKPTNMAILAGMILIAEPRE